jgi:hypothetical protein
MAADNVAEAPADEKTVSLPVSKKEVKVRRIKWGERLEIDEKSAVAGRFSVREFRYQLVHYATCSGYGKDDGMSREEFMEMDQTDGYFLVEEVSKMNTIDGPGFLAPSGKGDPGADTPTH